MREYNIKIFSNCCKVVCTDGKTVEIREYESVAGAMQYIQNKENRRRDMSEAQNKFAAAFPDKIIDCDIPGHIDIDKLIHALRYNTSDWFRSQKNITLKSCIKHYNKILDGFYKDFGSGKHTENIMRRNYTREQLNDIFTDQEAYEV